MRVKSFTYFSSAKISSLRNLNGLPWPARPILARISMTQYMFGFTGSSAIQSPQMVVYATFTPLYLFEKKIFLLEKMVSTQGQETQYNLWCLCVSVVISWPNWKLKFRVWQELLFQTLYPKLGIPMWHS